MAVIESATDLLYLAAWCTDREQDEDALRYLDAALQVSPDDLKARGARAATLLRLGKYSEAFEFIGGRSVNTEMQGLIAAIPQQRWNGEALDGRRLLVLGEQGLGDMLHFSRYIPMIVERGGTVTFGCPQLLHRLFNQSMDVECTAEVDSNTVFDTWCAIADLPRLFSASEAELFGSVPYLTIDSALTEAWRERLPETSGLRVGLVWAGSPLNEKDNLRSIPLADFAPLGSVQGVTFVSLQVGDQAEQATTPPRGMTMIDPHSMIKDFADTAAIIANLDLVISVDTATAHLAGALGAHAWNLLRFNGDWRWQLYRSDTPWYQTMQLFRQRRAGDWQSVMQQVATELHRYVMVGCEN